MCPLTSNVQYVGRAPYVQLEGQIWTHLLLPLVARQGCYSVHTRYIASEYSNYGYVQNGQLVTLTELM